MHIRKHGVIFAEESTFAYKIREKVKRLGLDVQYINKTSEIFSHLSNANIEIIIIDESMINYIDIFSFYCNNKTNNVLVICVKEKYDGVKCEGQNIYTCDYVALDFLIPMLMDKPIKTNNSNTVMSDELAYKLATEILLEFKFSQTLSGYTFIKQCIIEGIKYDMSHLNFTQNIYSEVAIKNKTSVSNVEKAIRVAITKTKQLHPEVFNIEGLIDRKITNSVLITFFIINVRLRYINSNLKIS